MDDWERVPHRPEVDDRLSDLFTLMSAADPEGLWRALVVPAYGSRWDHWMGVSLFRRHHGDGTPGALTTAQLLCTDLRWDGCTARLIAGIADTSILAESDLDALAAAFLWSDRILFEHPVSWIGLEWVAIDPEGRGSVDAPVMRLDPDTPVPVRRRIPPPLRRWAASRTLRSDPGRFGEMHRRAVELGARDGGAVLSGMLDAFEALDPEVGGQAIDIGLAWSLGSVRRLALDRLAAVDLAAAVRRAAADPDAKVRRWVPPHAGASPVGPGSNRQAELFPQ